MPEGSLYIIIIIVDDFHLIYIEISEDLRAAGILYIRISPVSSVHISQEHELIDTSGQEMENYFLCLK